MRAGLYVTLVAAGATTVGFEFTCQSREPRRVGGSDGVLRQAVDADVPCDQNRDDGQDNHGECPDGTLLGGGQGAHADTVAELKTTPFSTPEALYGALTSADAARLDAASEVAGTPVAQLMDAAGAQVARCARGLLTQLGLDRVIVVAGSGNNGGDGLVAARCLREAGVAVDACVVADPQRWRHAALAALAVAAGVGVAVDSGGTATGGVIRKGQNALVVDALLGTGLRSAPRAGHASVIAAMADSLVLSVDIPSGLDATTGLGSGVSVRAVATCTLAAMKSGLWNPTAAEYCGEIWVADIGVPAAAWTAIALQAPTLVVDGALVRVPVLT